MDFLIPFSFGCAAGAFVCAGFVNAKWVVGASTGLPVKWGRQLYLVKKHPGKSPPQQNPTM